MRWLVVLVLAVAGVSGGEQCRSWEFSCGGEGGPRCLSRNRFCDGIEDCADAADEPPGCTNCNQSLLGEVGAKYPLRITEPTQRHQPFRCTLHLVAGGGNTLGERLEITFLSFQIGALALHRNSSEDQLECNKGNMRLSETHEDLFLGDEGGGGATLRSQQTRGFSQLLSAFKEPRRLSTLYDPTAGARPSFGLFCGALRGHDLGVAFYSEGNNVTLDIFLPPRPAPTTPRGGTSFSLYLTYRFLSPTAASRGSSGDPEPPSLYLGKVVGSSYCDRHFVNCEQRRCIIRSPNFPGLYLRNFTCNYFLRQETVPPGQGARILVRQDNEYKVSVNTGSALARSADARQGLNQGNAGLSSDCSGDVVRIYDRIDSERGTGRLLLTHFCESGALPAIVSSGPEMLVQLHSSSANLLYESRLELEVNVEFYDLNKTLGQLDFDSEAKCHILINSSALRSGTIRSPAHNLPKNTTCVAKLVGNRSQRVWLYFISYFVKHRDAGFDHQSPVDDVEENCDVSSLELLMNASDSKSSQSNATFKFCEKTLPVMCARAADYENFIPQRPCLPPTESYISEGPDVVLKYSLFLSASNIISSLIASSFLIRYEFVDIEDSFDFNQMKLPPKVLEKNITSSTNASGVIVSPKNVFFYGRGGRDRLLCNYHFKLKSQERIEIEIVKFQTNIRSCTTFLDPLLRRYDCRFRNGPSSFQLISEISVPSRHSFITFTESSISSSMLFGCMCDSAAALGSTIIFSSSSFGHASSVTMTFDVSGMYSFEDFNHFHFEVMYKIITLDPKRKECTVLPDKLDRNRTHGGELTFQATPPKPSAPLRCRWLLQSSSSEAYLYLQLNGKPCDNRFKSEEQNRIVLHSSNANGFVYPKMVLCSPSSRDSESKPGGRIFDFFSSSWHNNDSSIMPKEVATTAFHDKNQSTSDKVIVEFMAYRTATLTLRWLEVTRPSSGPTNGEVYSDDGHSLRNVNCLHECPELSACINPELWCDGVVHCPHSGFDEMAENCRQTYTLYIAIGVGCLVVCVGFVLASYLLFRRLSERRRLQTHPVSFDHRPHCIHHNQHHDSVPKSFPNGSPVFVMGVGTARKKKKNKDGFVRHIPAVEVRFPDLHM